MKFIKAFFLFALVGSLSMSFSNYGTMKPITNDPKQELAYFPVAGEGMTRYVIFLKKKSKESDYKIELIPGKVMSVDCNYHTLLGKMEEKTLEGWGYTYFQYASAGDAISTMMACPDGTKTDKFVAAEPILIDYNSKLPVVIYVPKGIEIKYKIWKGEKEAPAEEQ